MPPLPSSIIESATVRAIYAHYAGRLEKPRSYLGASVIGKPCARALWYEFRQCGKEEFSGRMIRLFQTGHLEELRMLQNLRDIGCTVYPLDEAGNQWAVSEIAGHFGGHMDGVAIGIPEAPKAWHVLEFKTHELKSFTALKKKGVKESNPRHFAQMQIYMHLSEGIDRALYLAVHKDTDELYAERIHYDRAEAERILARARMIIESPRPPEKIGERDSFSCKWCAHKDRCHGSADPTAPAVGCAVVCRTCCHATPVTSGGHTAGTWVCERHGGKALSESEQARACEDHLFIPDLITFADGVDSWQAEEGDGISYATADGRSFTNSTSAGGYRSIELTQLPASAIGDPVFEAARKELGARVTNEEEITK